jgi:hypothetical protein
MTTTHSTTPSNTQYAIARNLKGFGTDTLRVKVLRVASPYDVIVVTADLVDAGTTLAISPEQLTPEEPETVSFHKSGLVAF